MKKKIARNEYYEAYVDVEINRMYWVNRGHWENLSDIPDYRKHNIETLGHLKPGFTAVIDLKDMEIPGSEVLGLITEMVKMTENAGLKRQAQVINKEFLEGIRTSRDLIKESDIDTKMMQLGTFEEAVEWFNR